MVKKENAPNLSNSLLKTAATKRLGAGKFALRALRSNNIPPLKRVTVPVPGSQHSRVSDLTGEVDGLARPANVKEIRNDDIEVESSILEMSMNSGNSSAFSASKAYGGKGSQKASMPITSLGKAVKTTPQPRSSDHKLPVNERKPLQKKSMEIQKGITISAPSPMTLDRIQVQMGQEHSAPESKEYRQWQNEMKSKHEEEMKRELHEKAKREEKLKLIEEIQREEGKGFEAQIEGFAPDEDQVGKKKSLVKKILGKIRSKSPKKKKHDTGPLSASEARSLARRALLSTRQKPSGLPANAFFDNDVQAPVAEVLVKIKEDSISDLDASVKRFPVNEIRMNDDDQARDDENTVSTLGTPQIFDRKMNTKFGLPPLPNSEFRDPTLTDEIHGVGHQETEEAGLQQQDNRKQSPDADDMQHIGLVDTEHKVAENIENEQSDSRMLHRNGKALLDQVESISAFSPIADNTIADATAGTEVIETRLGGGGCEASRIANASKKETSTEKNGTTQKRGLFSAFCHGGGPIEDSEKEGQSRYTEKEVMEKADKIMELHGIPNFQQEAEGPDDDGGSKTNAIETSVDQLLEPQGNNTREIGDKTIPLSPTSAFNKAIDDAIHQVETEMRGGDSSRGLHHVAPSTKSASILADPVRTLARDSLSGESDILKALSPINEDDDESRVSKKSPREDEADNEGGKEGCDKLSIPELEGSDGKPVGIMQSIDGNIEVETKEVLVQPKPSSKKHFEERPTLSIEEDLEMDVIDLTNVPSGIFEEKDSFGMRHDKYNEFSSIFASDEKSSSPVSFDDFMQIAASKLGFSNVSSKGEGQADRYATERDDDSPKHVILGEHVDMQGSRKSVPVVQGVDISNPTKNATTELTPKACGGSNKGAFFEDLSNHSSPNESKRNLRSGELTNDVGSMDTENLFPSNSNAKDQVRTKSTRPMAQDGQEEKLIQNRDPSGRRDTKESDNDFEGYFADGLFDLLSTDGSVNRRSMNQRQPKTIIQEGIASGLVSPERKMQAKGSKSVKKKDDVLDSVFEYSETMLCGKRKEGSNELLHSGHSLESTSKGKSEGLEEDIKIDSTTMGNRQALFSTCENDDRSKVNSDGEVKPSFAMQAKGSKSVKKKDDVLDSVFEYSETMLCGKRKEGSNELLHSGHSLESTSKGKSEGLEEDIKIDSTTMGNRQALFSTCENDDRSKVNSDGEVKPSFAMMCGAVPLYLFGAKERGNSEKPIEKRQDETVANDVFEEFEKRKVSPNREREMRASLCDSHSTTDDELPVPSGPSNQGQEIARTTVQTVQTVHEGSASDPESFAVQIFPSPRQKKSDEKWNPNSFQRADFFVQQQPDVNWNSSHPTDMFRHEFASDEDNTESTQTAQERISQEERTPIIVQEEMAPVIVQEVATISTGGRSSKSSRRRRQAPPTPERVGTREAILLEKDDVYWDTLSTIASTKERSAEKIADVTSTKPGPIPEEITMTNDKSSAPIQPQYGDNNNEKTIQQSIQKLNSLMEEENRERNRGIKAIEHTDDVKGEASQVKSMSGGRHHQDEQAFSDHENKSGPAMTKQENQRKNSRMEDDDSEPSLSYSMETSGANQISLRDNMPRPERASKTRSHGRMSKSGSICGDEPIRAPPFRKSPVGFGSVDGKSSDSVSRSSRVSNLIAQFEATLTKKEGKVTPPIRFQDRSRTSDNDRSFNDPASSSNSSDNNSELLLAVTRSAAEETRSEGTNVMSENLKPPSEFNGNSVGSSTGAEEEPVKSEVEKSVYTEPKQHYDEFNETTIDGSRDRSLSATSASAEASNFYQREVLGLDTSSLPATTGNVEVSDSSRVLGVSSSIGNRPLPETSASESHRRKMTEASTVDSHDRLSYTGGSGSGKNASYIDDGMTNHVSWGYEEIYDPPETGDGVSSTSPSSLHVEEPKDLPPSVATDRSSAPKSATAQPENDSEDFEVAEGEIIVRESDELLELSNIFDGIKIEPRQPEVVAAEATETIEGRSISRESNKSPQTSSTRTPSTPSNYGDNAPQARSSFSAARNSVATSHLRSDDGSQVENGSWNVQSNYGDGNISSYSHAKDAPAAETSLSTARNSLPREDPFSNDGSQISRSSRNIQSVYGSENIPSHNIDVPQDETTFSTTRSSLPRQDPSANDGSQGDHRTQSGVADVNVSRLDYPTVVSTKEEDLLCNLQRSLGLESVMEEESTADYNPNDDIDLISRTIQLSKELLSTMSVQDIEEADDEVVRSLMSFGTEDSEKFSLSLGQQDTEPTLPRAAGENMIQDELPVKTMEVGPSVQNMDFQGFSEGTTKSGEDNTRFTGPRFSSKYSSGLYSSISSKNGQGTTPSTEPQFLSDYNAGLHSSVGTRGVIPSSVTLKSRTQSDELRSRGHLPLGPTSTASLARDSLSILTRSDKSGSHLPPGSKTGLAGPTFTTSLARDSISNPTRSDMDSSNSPIDVQKLFSRYDNFASQLIEQNDRLKQSNHAGESIQDVEGGSNFTPQILNRLDELRAQRAEALARFQLSRPHQPLVDTKEITKDQLRYYPGSYGSSSLQSGSLRTNQYLNGLSHPPQTVAVSSEGINTNYPNIQPLGLAGYQGDREVDSVSTTTSSMTAASKKARELRRQLDEALKASKEIRMTQEKLGSELRTFKNKFYQRNEELEGQAFRAMLGE